MTRWLAAVSLVALLGGAVQAHANELPSEGDGGSCGQNSGKMCEEKTVSICTEYRGTGFELSGSTSSITAGYKVECAKWENSTVRKYYPA